MICYSRSSVGEELWDGLGRREKTQNGGYSVCVCVCVFFFFLNTVPRAWRAIPKVLARLVNVQFPEQFLERRRIDLIHDDVTRPKDSMVVVVTLKSKMAASSASSGEIVKVRGI